MALNKKGSRRITVDGTEYRWWDEAATYEPRSDQVIYLFRKRLPTDEIAR